MNEIKRGKMTWVRFEHDTRFNLYSPLEEVNDKIDNFNKSLIGLFGYKCMGDDNEVFRENNKQDVINCLEYFIINLGKPFTQQHIEFIEEEF